MLLAVLAAVLAPLPASAARDAGPAPDRFTGTAALPGCSGAVVRWPAALDTDPAVVLTNGHCVQQPFLGARDVLVDERRWMPIELLDGSGKVARSVRGVRLQYASMYRTDVALVSLRETYADLAGDGIAPLFLAEAGPSRAGSRMESHQSHARSWSRYAVPVVTHARCSPHSPWPALPP